jgi:hypothetical protein
MAFEKHGIKPGREGDYSNFSKKKEFEKKKTKGENFREKLKKAIKETDFRESKDRNKKLKRPNVPGPEKKSDNMMGKNTERSSENLKKEFNERFNPPKAPLPSQIPEGMQPLSRGGRAGFKRGTRGCKLATKGKGRAYGKNS